MKCPDIPENDEARLKALAEYALDESVSLSSLAPVVKIASRMFGMPLSAVNMISSDHVFFAASHGIEPGGVNMSRDASFCAHAILAEEGMVVPDATQDDRFHDNPLVVGDSHIRFYAGVPIRSPEGHALGALCILDTTPHQFSVDDHARLADLAKMASDRLELRRIEVASHLLAHQEDEGRNFIQFDRSLAIKCWTEAVAQLHGYQLGEGVELLVCDVFREDENVDFWSCVRQAIKTGEWHVVPPFQVRSRRKDGAEISLSVSLSRQREGSDIRFAANLRNIRESSQEASPVVDPVTGLKSRQRFYRKVEEAVTREAKAAIVMIDIDGFSDLNDTLGHTTGDQILREAAKRLQASANESHLLARIGGDEFGMLLPEIGDSIQAGKVAKQAMDSVAAITMIDGNAIQLSACCGIAVAPEHGFEALELIANADLALSKAKKEGHNQLHVFTPELRQAASARRLYALELMRASTDSEFVLFYQPQVRLSDGVLIGAEALIRWAHPVQGILPPASFLPALEKGCLASTVGSWILDEACAQAARWRARWSAFRMSVNLFGAQFRSGGLAADIENVLGRHALASDALEIELTENIALDYDEIAVRTLQRIRDMGVHIAFDDFGTGFASLTSLSRYPITHIKIDRSFVQSIPGSRRDASVVNAILDIARNFNIEVIAEGIETDEQRAYLARRRCAEGQGYFFGKPMPAQEFEQRFPMVTES